MVLTLWKVEALHHVAENDEKSFMRKKKKEEDKMKHQTRKTKKEDSQVKAKQRWPNTNEAISTQVWLL